MLQLIREMIRVLWNDNITVEYVMYLMYGTTGSATVTAMCYDEDDEDTDLVATAEWKYDRSRPRGKAWILESVEVSDDVPEGWK